MFFEMPKNEISLCVSMDNNGMLFFQLVHKCFKKCLLFLTG